MRAANTFELGEVLSGRITVEANIIATRIKHNRDAFKAIDPAFDAIRTERAAGYRWVDAELTLAGARV